MTREAVISECGMYRYRLDRDGINDDGPVYAFFGINPSTADASIDDATVRKWNGFTKRLGGSRYIVGNVFSYRATDVKELKTAEDPFGPEFADYLCEIIFEADILVPCWGNTSKAPKELYGAFGNLLSCLYDTDKPVMTWGLTKSGDPKHPLMLGYSTPLLDMRKL